MRRAEHIDEYPLLWGMDIFCFNSWIAFLYCTYFHLAFAVYIP